MDGNVDGSRLNIYKEKYNVNYSVQVSTVQKTNKQNKQNRTDIDYINKYFHEQLKIPSM